MARTSMSVKTMMMKFYNQVTQVPHDQVSWKPSNPVQPDFRPFHSTHITSSKVSNNFLLVKLNSTFVAFLHSIFLLHSTVKLPPSEVSLQFVTFDFFVFLLPLQTCHPLLALPFRTPLNIGILPSDLLKSHYLSGKGVSY